MITPNFDRLQEIRDRVLLACVVRGNYGLGVMLLRFKQAAQDGRRNYGVAVGVIDQHCYRGIGRMRSPVLDREIAARDVMMEARIVGMMIDIDDGASADGRLPTPRRRRPQLTAFDIAIRDQDAFGVSSVEYFTRP